MARDSKSAALRERLANRKKRADRPFIFKGELTRLARRHKLSRERASKVVQWLSERGRIKYVDIPESRFKALDALAKHDLSGLFIFDQVLHLPDYAVDAAAKEAGVKRRDVIELLQILKKDGVKIKFLGSKQTKIRKNLLNWYRKTGSVPIWYINQVAYAEIVRVFTVEKEIRNMVSEHIMNPQRLAPRKRGPKPGSRRRVA